MPRSLHQELSIAIGIYVASRLVCIFSSGPQPGHQETPSKTICTFMWKSQIVLFLNRLRMQISLKSTEEPNIIMSRKPNSPSASDTLSGSTKYHYKIASKFCGMSYPCCIHLSVLSFTVLFMLRFKLSFFSL